MKCYYLVGSLTVTWLFTTSSVFKTPDLPEAVKITFQKHYSAARKVKWEKQGDVYEAEFLMDKLDMSAIFDTAGIILETEIEIPVSELPLFCRAGIEEKFPDEKIKEAAKIIKTDGTVFYEAEVNGRDIFFDAQGNLLKLQE